MPDIASALDRAAEIYSPGEPIRLYSADFKRLIKMNVYGWKGHPIIDGGPKKKRSKRVQESLI